MSEEVRPLIEQEMKSMREWLANDTALAHGWTIRLVATVDARDEQIAALRRELAESQQAHGNLLALIHRDGGQYLAEHGWKKAQEDAVQAWASLQRELEEAKAENGSLRRNLNSVLKETSEIEAQLRHSCGAGLPPPRLACGD